MLNKILLRNILHPTDLQRYIIPTLYRVRHLFNILLVHLHTMNLQPGACEQLLVADVTLKVLRLLMLQQDLLVLELAVTVPAPWLHGLLLFATHIS